MTVLTASEQIGVLTQIENLIDSLSDEGTKHIAKYIKDVRKEKGFTKPTVKKAHLEARKTAVKSIENQAFGLNKCYKIAVSLVKGKSATKTQKAIEPLTIDPREWMDPLKDFQESQLDFVMKSLKNTCRFLSEKDKEAGTTKTLTPKMIINSWVRVAQMKQSTFGKIAYA